MTPTGGRPAVLEVHRVTKRYGSEPPVVALHDVSFTAAAGELVAVVGPSGSDKSTLLHVMGTLDRPTDGTVSITGLDVAGLSDRGPWRGWASAAGRPPGPRSSRAGSASAWRSPGPWWARPRSSCSTSCTARGPPSW